jgi:PAS domain S-box-containing protein
MTTVDQQYTLPAVASLAIGLAVSLLIHTPFGLLAPLVALFLFACDRTAVLVQVASAVGLLGSLLVTAIYEGATRDIAAEWAAFFALANCIGALVATRASAETMPAAIRSTTPYEAPSYPVIGPTLGEKAAPRHSPLVGISAQDDKTTAAQLVAVSFWGGTRVHLRYWRRHCDGSYRWVESRSEPFREPSGTQVWRGVTADIDDQRPGLEPPTRIASNAPSNDSAVRAAKIVEKLIGNAWAFDAAGRPTYLTPLAQTFVAATLEEFQAAVDEGHTFFKRTAHPDDYERISGAWRHSLQTGDPFFLDRRIRRASGIHEWNRTGIVPTRDRHGRITGWYGTTIDLDAHRIAEAELRDRERELLQLVAMVPSHIWRLTPNGEPIFFNQRMVDFLGLDVADMDRPGMSRLEAMIETVHPDNAAEFKDTLRRCFATGESFTMRYRLRRADGIYRWMSSRAEPMRGQDGRILQWYGLCHDIDDQMLLFSELEEREARIRRLVDSDIIGIVIWDLDGRLVDANDAFLRMVQCGREDLQAGLRWFDMTPPEWQDVHACDEVEELKTTGMMQAREKEFFRKDGSRVPVLIGAACFEGQSRQGVAYILDLTERKRAERALRERERELSQLVDIVPVHIRRLTPEGEPVFFNKRLIDFLGLDIADFYEMEMGRLSTALQTLVHPDDLANVREVVRRSLANGEPYAMKYRIRRADGAYRWVDGRAEPVRDETGTIVQWYSVSFDIDDQVRAQEALRDSERMLRQLVETLPAMIDCTAPDGEPIYRSRQLREFLGYDLDNLDETGGSRLIQTLDASVHPYDLAGVKESYANSLATGAPYARKHRLRRFDGEYRWVETRAAAMRNAEGTIQQWNVICLDINDQVRAEAELRLAQERLARASQEASLAELSASIAHEVNQPLAAIVANSNACQRWLRSNPPNLDRAQTTVERIIRDANAAADIVSRIRALFKQSVELRSFTTLPGVIAEARGLMAEEAARRRVQMVIDIQSPLPLVAFDRVQIQQVLINLMRNGMDAMDGMGGDEILGMSVRHADDAVQIEISDLGQGIEFPDKIFEPFFTTKANGMGMGLAICRSIVESHGGRLWAEKNEPKGARFIFTLPVDAKAAP